MLPFRTTQSGARTYGHVPQVAPEAYLHTFHAGATSEQLMQLGEQLGRAVPEYWQGALLACNGVVLFVRCLSLCGVLTDGLMRRTGDPAPHSLWEANRGQRPRGRAVRGDDFVVGSLVIVNDVSVYVLRSDDTLARVDRTGRKLQREWDTLDELLIDEYEELGRLYKAGQILRPRPRE